ncbi:unnamed protein product [Chrysoparadoxa australica]
MAVGVKPSRPHPTLDPDVANAGASSYGSVLVSPIVGNKPRNPDNQDLRRNCDYCVRKKVKCNGELPCHMCRRKNFVCVYSVKQKPGPKVRTGLDTGGRRQSKGLRSKSSVQSSVGTQQQHQQPQQASYGRSYTSPQMQQQQQQQQQHGHYLQQHQHHQYHSHVVRPHSYAPSGAGPYTVSQTAHDSVAGQRPYLAPGGSTPLPAPPHGHYQHRSMHGHGPGQYGPQEPQPRPQGQPQPYSSGHSGSGGSGSGQSGNAGGGSIPSFSAQAPTQEDVASIPKEVTEALLALKYSK